MKAILSAEFGLEALELRELDMPVIEDHQALVRVRASSVNPAEWYRVTGPYFTRMFGGGLRRPKSPLVGGDLAGTVEVVGRDVEEFQPGDEVFGTTLGAWAEYAPAREVRLAPKPSNVSFEEAAAVPIAATTALQALRDHGRVQPGQKVLINGASGGVGTFAVQIAKSFGAQVTAVCSTENVDLARSLGADEVVDYTREDFTRRADRHELMLDIAGSRSFGEFRRALTPEATIVLVGARFPSNRASDPLSHHRNARGRPRPKPGREVLHCEDHEGGPPRPTGARRGREGEAGHRQAIRAERRRRCPQVSGEGHARGKVVLTPGK